MSSPTEATATLEDFAENVAAVDNKVNNANDEASSAAVDDDDDGKVGDDDGDVSTTTTTTTLKRKRRSQRNTNRIVLSDKSSLQYRRLQELFFHEPPSPHSIHNKSRTSNSNSMTMNIGNLTLQRVHASPNIYVIDNFLSPTEIQHLRTKISQGGFQRSYVDAMPGSPQEQDQQQESTTTQSLYDNQHRTSTFLSFTKQQDSKIAAIEHRAANLLGCWSSQCIEPLQLVRYKPGQFFGVHHDLGDLEEDGTVTLPPRSLVFGKRRLVTLFCYLNTLPQAADDKDKKKTSLSSRNGATNFPAAINNNNRNKNNNAHKQNGVTNHRYKTRHQKQQQEQPKPSEQNEEEDEQVEEQGLLVQPVQGRAVLFCNVTEEGLPDARTIHAGLPPILQQPKKKGSKKKKKNVNGNNDDEEHFLTNKYGLNIWMCED